MNYQNKTKEQLIDELLELQRKLDTVHLNLFTPPIERSFIDQKLIESEERYKRITASITDYLYTVIVENGKALETIHNSACFTVTGYTPNEFENDPYLWINMVVPEERASIATRFSEILTGKDLPNTVEHRIICKDGTIKWVSDTTIPKYNEKGQIVSYDGVIKDITELKLAENELIESEAKFRSIFDQSPVGSVIVGLDKRIIGCNSAFCKFLAYSENELIGKTISDITYPEDIDLGMNELRQITAGDIESSIIQKRYIRKDGNIVWGEVSICLVRDVNNKPLYFLPIIQDITERKQVEDELKYEQYLMQALMNNLPESIYFKDSKSRFIRISNAQARLFGLSDPKQAIGKTDFDFFTSEHAQKAYEDEQEIIRMGKTIRKEEKETWADYPDSWVSTTKLPLHDKDQKIIGTFGISVYITERKLAEEALRLRESYLSAIIENQPGLLWLKDKNGKFLIVNSKFANQCGFGKPELLIGKTDLDIWPYELAVKYIADDIMVMESGKPYILEEPISDKDKINWFETFKTPVIDKNGKVIGTTGYSREITERKNTEQQIKQKNTELQELITDKDHFLSILAHDLKSPFNSMLGFLQLLTQNIRQYDIDKIEKQINFVNISANRVYNLLEDILLWAMAQSGKIPFRPQKLNFTAVCNEVVEILRPNAITKNITINYFASEETYILADMNMLKTILRNLVSNAIKFTNHGGRVDIYAEYSQENATITVSDNGIGIVPEKLVKLFDISQIQTTKGTAKEEGTGIGLLLCKEFVAKHGGKIWAESKLGIGSEFKFTVPY